MLEYDTDFFSSSNPTITDDMRNGKTYDGNMFKFGITLKNVDYIVKSAKASDMSAYSEYIAGSFINCLGVPCQKVEWGIYKGEFAVLVREFSNDFSGFLHCFKDILQSFEDTDSVSTDYTYADITYVIQNRLKMTEENKQQALAQFWDMFICDAILANRDRHRGNWGFFADTSGELTFAQIYDNGACLFPGVRQEIEDYINPAARKDFLYQRIFNIPKSLFRIEKSGRSYRSNYSEICHSSFPLLKARMKRMASMFSVDAVISYMQKIVSNLPLEDEYKRFCVEIAALRYYCLILESDFEAAFAEVEHELKESAL